MRKLFMMTFVLFLTYFLFQVVFTLFIDSKKTTYEIKDEETTIKILEIFNANKKEDQDNYLLSFEVEDTKFSLLTYQNFGKITKIVNMVKYFKEPGLGCIFVKYKDNKILSDVICKNNEYMIAYNNMKNPSSGLKEFVLSLKEFGYDEIKWKNDTTTSGSANLVFNVNNIPSNHYIGAATPMEYFRINETDKVHREEINNEGSKVHALLDGKYITLRGQKLYVYNLSNSGEETFDIDKVSDSTFVIGTRNNSVYIFDPSNKKEYEIDIKTKKMIEVGNETTGILYLENGEMIRKPLSNVDIKTIKFGDKYKNDYENPNYVRIIKAGYKTGYYYLFKKTSKGYEVYKSLINHKEDIMYLFDTNDISKVFIVEEYIYCQSDNVIYSYSDDMGYRKVLENILDKSMLIHIYAK